MQRIQMEIAYSSPVVARHFGLDGRLVLRLCIAGPRSGYAALHDMNVANLTNIAAVCMYTLF